MSKSIDVYWSSYSDDEKYDWSILYETPESVYRNISQNIVKENIDVSFFRCPAFKKNSTSTFVIKNPMTSSYNFLNNSISYNNVGIFAEIVRPPAIKNNIMFKYSFPHVFFSEEDLEITFSAPYFHKANHLQYGAVVPGTYNISSWIRPIQFEINLWEGVNNFIIEENEPIAYVSFLTHKKINLKRFKITNNLKKIIDTCSKGGDWEPNVSILKRYSRFKKSQTKDFVIKEIKNNLY